VWVQFYCQSKFQLEVFHGIATILYYLLNIPADIGIFLINIPAFLITWKVVGFKYGLKSLIGTLGCSIGITLGESMGGLTSDFILAALYGGVISGIGLALTYRAGGSTGGTDLIAKLVHVKKPYMNMGNILLLVDGIIIMILAITFNSIEVALYSVVSVFVMTKVLNLILEGVDYAKAVFVITEKPEEISNLIHSEIERTTTKIDAIGTYSNKEKSILLCVVNYKEIPRLKQIIREIDNKSFTIVTSVTEAIGEGFKIEI
jgi:uncharacterized membrane-anchored protein YitT (DUF2179 family)